MIPSASCPTIGAGIYIYMGNRLLVYEYNNHKDDRLIIQEAEHHMSQNTFTYYTKT